MAFTSPPWWSEDTVAVVTGANKNIGFEIVRIFADQGLTVVLTARDPGRGQAAIDTLKAGGQKNVYFHPLDVKSSESVETLAAWLRKEFGGIDILVNNAAIAAGPSGLGTVVDYENAKEIVETNYYGVKNVTEGLLPLLRSSPAAARIVNVTSRAGLYERLRSEKLKQPFRDEESFTTELIDSIATKYLEDVKAERWEEEGWIENGAAKFPMYSESKIFLSAYAIVLAKSLSKSQAEDHQILVASYSPGVTQTDLLDKAVKDGFELPAGFRPKTLAEGADTGVWLALLPREELAQKNGKFFKDREEWGLAGNYRSASKTDNGVCLT